MPAWNRRNKRNKAQSVTGVEEKQISGSVFGGRSARSHLRAPSGSAWSPPPPARWGAVSDDRSSGLLSQSTTSSPSGEGEALHLSLSLQGSFCSGFFFPCSQWTHGAGSRTRPTYPESSRTRCAHRCEGPPSCHPLGAVRPLSGCSAVG